jgi:hypothetical protein
MSGLRSRPGEKHGPNATGDAGPCDPGCLKCAVEARHAALVRSLIDGQALGRLLEIDTAHRRESFGVAPRHFTPAQRAAVSAHWSAELRARIATTLAPAINPIRITPED